MPESEFFIVTWYTEGEGNFNNFIQSAQSVQEAIEVFESEFPKNKVIHIFDGATPRKPYSFNYLINIGLLALNESTNQLKYIKVPFEYTIENGIVEFWMIDESELPFLFKPSLVDSLQSTADILLGTDEARFYLNYKNGSKVMNWNRILTYV